MSFRLLYHVNSHGIVEFSSWPKLLQDTLGYEAVDCELARGGLPTISRRIERRWLGESADDMVEFFVDMAGEGLLNADQKFTQGDCDVFVAALLEVIPDGVPVAVFDPVNPETGRKTRGAPYLIHAGVMVEDTVYDVRGAHDARTWIGRWFENGNASEYAGWDTVELKDLTRMQRSKITAEQIDEAKPFADIVATLCLGADEASPAHGNNRWSPRG
ncbi:hypothetical protein HFO56_01400 [Rhizobium laguerreae]|uniref:hypothetical protein n=1 Tax=Rhizobium laguerreae TaxID=1076926 RepID=UPI001C91B9A1|nr:hypothetical protein [Rhizobium laguerreae]MBY3151065.1 hypothetical protein [Rhizobium laguerreae]